MLLEGKQPRARKREKWAGPRVVAHPEASEKQIVTGEEVDEQPVVVDAGSVGEEGEVEDAGLGVVVQLLLQRPVVDVLLLLRCELHGCGGVVSSGSGGVAHGKERRGGRGRARRRDQEGDGMLGFGGELIGRCLAL